jgi:hypothetical protein
MAEKDEERMFSAWALRYRAASGEAVGGRREVSIREERV